jgi:hypothetical protein
MEKLLVQGMFSIKRKLDSGDKICSKVYFTETDDLFFFNDQQEFVKMKITGVKKDSKATVEYSRFKLDSALEELTRIDPFMNMFLIQLNSSYEEHSLMLLFDP